MENIGVNKEDMFTNSGNNNENSHILVLGSSSTWIQLL